MRLGNPGLAVDTAAENNGKWVDCPSEWTPVGGTRPTVLVCGIESPGYRSALRERKIEKLSPEQADLVLIELVSEHLLKGWRHFVDERGIEVPYTAETCRSVCLNRDNRRLVDFVLSKAASRSTFDVEAAADDAKNFGTLSAGS